MSLSEIVDDPETANTFRMQGYHQAAKTLSTVPPRDCEWCFWVLACSVQLSTAFYRYLGPLSVVSCVFWQNGLPNPTSDDPNTNATLVMPFLLWRWAKPKAKSHSKSQAKPKRKQLNAPIKVPLLADLRHSLFPIWMGCSAIVFMQISVSVSIGLWLYAGQRNTEIIIIMNPKRIHPKWKAPESVFWVQAFVISQSYANIFMALNLNWKSQDKSVAVLSPKKLERFPSSLHIWLSTIQSYI